jgi:hypothetical protein
MRCSSAVVDPQSKATKIPDHEDHFFRGMTISFAGAKMLCLQG